MEENPSATPLPGRGDSPEAPRRRSGRRSGISIPSLARRGRITIKHLFLLLLGGFVSSVESSRRRGARGLLFRFRALIAWFCRRFIDRDIAAMPFPAQLRKRLELLGPTYVKFGQILSLRQDLLPPVVTVELRNLLSDLPPVSFEEIRAVIESDLGRSLEEMFTAVAEVPLGSASIAQSHRAHTKDGDDVILKVVKPGIRELVFRDAALLQTTGRFLQLIIPRYQPRRVINEFCDYTVREVEMTIEAENAETFAANFTDMEDIVFPKIFREFSADNVLCMSFLDGVRPDHPSVRELPIDARQRLIDLGAASIIRMLYQDGFFHADLHPANLLVLENARVGFIDLGMVGQFDPELRHNLLHLFYALVMEDFDRASRHLAAVSRTEARSDVLGFRRAVKEVARKWRARATFEEFSLALLILECVQLGARYHLYFPVEMVLMIKALVTFEGVGYLLDPAFNVAQISERHIGRIFRLEFSPRRLMREGMRAAPDILNALFKLPLLVSEGLNVMEDRTQRRPRNALTGVRATLYGGFCMVAGAILMAADGPWYLAALLLLIGALVPLRRGD